MKAMPIITIIAQLLMSMISTKLEAPGKVYIGHTCMFTCECMYMYISSL